MTLTKIKNKDSKSFLIQTVITFVVLTATSLHSKPYIILDGESPYTLPQKSLEARLMAGYESGYIPDYFIRPWLDLGITDRLTLGGGVYYTWFPDQDISRMSEWELRGKIKLLELSPGNVKPFNYEKMPLFGYLKYRKSNETIIVPYDGSMSGVSGVVSPRADGGWDFTAGLSTRLEFKISG